MTPTQLLKIPALFAFLLLCTRCHNNDECEAGTDLPVLDGWLVKNVNGPLMQTGEVLDFVFTDKQTGYFSTTGGSVYKTNNGGAQWESLDLGTGGGARKPGVLCFRWDFGWIAADTTGLSITGTFPFAKFWSTNDGGVSWNLRQTNVQGIFKSLYFIGPLTGFAVIQRQNASFGLYYTSDGGMNWAPNLNITLGTTPLWTYQLYHPETVYIVDAFGKIWKSVDTGNLWVPFVQFTNTKFHQFQVTDDEAVFFTDDEGLAVFESGKPLNRVTENTTHMLFFNKDHAGITIQKDAACNQGVLDTRFFDNGYRSLAGSTQNGSGWHESENSRALYAWTCKPVDQDYAFCAYGFRLYYIELLK